MCFFSGNLNLVLILLLASEDALQWHLYVARVLDSAAVKIRSIAKQWPSELMSFEGNDVFIGLPIFAATSPLLLGFFNLPNRSWSLKLCRETSQSSFIPVSDGYA